MALDSVVPGTLEKLATETGLEFRVGIVVAVAADGTLVLDYGDQKPQRVLEQLARATRVIERRIMPGGRSVELGVNEP